MTKKRIIVVAPDKYKKLARNLALEIAKKDSLDGVYWSLKTYQDNEFTQSGNQYVLFIGNPDENEFTADFLESINIQKKAGHCYGYSGSKAIAYGEGNLDDLEESKKFWNEHAGVPIFAGLGAIISSATVLSLFATPIIVTLAFKLFSDRKKKKLLLKQQTKAATKSFLINDFDNWLGINPTNTSNSNE